MKARNYNNNSSTSIWSQKIKPVGLIAIYEMVQVLRSDWQPFGVKLAFNCEEHAKAFEREFEFFMSKHKLFLTKDSIVNFRTDKNINNILQLEFVHPSEESAAENDKAFHLLEKFKKYVDITDIPIKKRDCWQNYTVKEARELYFTMR